MSVQLPTEHRAASTLSDRGELRIIPAGRRHGDQERRYWSGRSWQLGSAAYWENIATSAPEPPSYRLGSDLAEELGACLLGGYGLPASLATLAFRRLRDCGVFQESARFSAADIEALLTEPFIEFGAARRYRFPRQRAMRLHGALRTLKAGNPPAQPLQLRDWLLQVPGIGPKTASWVVRNHTASNEVAIIDIHIIRAGTAAGVFDHRWRVERDYEQFEHAFLHWARHGEIAASLLDACVWGVLAHAGSDSRDILGTTRLSVAPQPVWPVDG